MSWWFNHFVKFHFPVGTLVVNVLGCLLIGMFARLTHPEDGWEIPQVVRQAAMIGFLGGFTTFSSFALQTMDMFHGGQWVEGSLNVFLSVTLCLLAVWGGWVLATLFVKNLA